MKAVTIISNYRKISISWNNLFLVLILSFPLCDILTGFLIFKVGLPESFIGSPSQLIRIIFIIYGLYTLYPKRQRICIISLLWLLALESLSFFYIPSIIPFFSGLNYGVKILYIIIFYYKTEQYCAISSNNVLKFQSTIFKVAIIYALGIIVPSLLGFGVASYSEGTFGQKGLLASGNAIGIFLGVINCLLILKKKKSFIQYLKLLIISISLILLATKTALLLFLLGLFFILIKLKPILRWTVLGLIIGIVIIYAEVIYDSIGIIADVIIFRFENRESFFSFLMSSRDIYVSEALEEFINSPIWLVKLFIGGGAFMSFRSQFMDGMVFDTLENEFFDIFFMYGLIGLILYLGVIIYFSLFILKRSKLLGLLFLLFCSHSIFVGHVLFDGIPVMAAVLIIQMAKNIAKERLEFKI